MRYWKIKDGIISLDRVLIMGILNATPDSFSDGGKYTDAHTAAKRAAEMVGMGADIIDIGGQSTRPGAQKISEKEEWERLRDVIAAVRQAVSVPISVDTFYPYVAIKAIEAGASIINDVTGFENEEMCAAAAQTGAGCVVMHCADITENADCIHSVGSFFERKAVKMEQMGIDRACLCFDPGIGFGKTREQEFELCARIGELRTGENPIMAALSRKRMIGACLAHDTRPDERDYGTTAAHAMAIESGADIIRVHNVEAAAQCIGVMSKLAAAKNSR